MAVSRLWLLFISDCSQVRGAPSGGPAQHLGISSSTLNPFAVFQICVKSCRATRTVCPYLQRGARTVHWVRSADISHSAEIPGNQNDEIVGPSGLPGRHYWRLLLDDRRWVGPVHIADPGMWKWLTANQLNREIPFLQHLRSIVSVRCSLFQVTGECLRQGGTFSQRHLYAASDTQSVSPPCLGWLGLI